MNEKRYHAEDQVNFVGLKNLVYAFLQEFYRFVAFTQLVIRKKAWYLVAGAILGIGFTLVHFYNRMDVYTADMVVIHNKLSKKTYGQVIQQLDMLVRNGEQSKFAGTLKLPSEIAEKIYRIEAFNTNNLPLLSDTSEKNYQTFKISLRLSGLVETDTISQAFINYFSNLPYLKRLNEVEKQYLRDRLTLVERDLAHLDTLKANFNRFLGSSRIASTVYSSAINPAEIYEQTIELIKQREGASRMLVAEENPIQILDSFKLVKLPRGRGLPDSLLIFGTIGLLTGFLFGLLLQTKEVVLPSR